MPSEGNLVDLEKTAAKLIDMGARPATYWNSHFPSASSQGIHPREALGLCRCGNTSRRGGQVGRCGLRVR
jgi:hypothetical protein